MTEEEIAIFLITILNSNENVSDMYCYLRPGTPMPDDESLARLAKSHAMTLVKYARPEPDGTSKDYGFTTKYGRSAHIIVPDE